MGSIDRFKEMINESNNIVFFGGAGVSTESGIPDFRSKDGLYNQKYKYPPEAILSHTFFMNKTAEFYEFYRDKLNSLKYEPNITHFKLAELEKQGKDISIVTQNIDGLHQKAGSKKVYELHGNVLRNYCMKCHKFYSIEDIYNKAFDIPYCSCGGMIKPDVVLYEEGLDDKSITSAIDYISKADMLIVVGTSLTVYPAAGFVRYFNGKYLVLLNKSQTPYDSMANIIIHDDVKKVVEELKK